MTTKRTAVAGMLLCLAACSTSENNPSVIPPPPAPALIASTNVPPIDQRKLLQRLLPNAGDGADKPVSYAPPLAPSPLLSILVVNPPQKPVISLDAHPAVVAPIPPVPTPMAATSTPPKKPVLSTIMGQPLGPPMGMKESQKILPAPMQRWNAAAKTSNTPSAAPITGVEPPLDYTPW